MQEFVKLTGIVLKTVPIGEYDRRVVILTKERGKISAFAKGARKPNSRLVAAASPFVFGEFKIYEGRTSYNIAEADIRNYFEGLREDFSAACYGMYFLEATDYYTRENNEEIEMLKLLYQSLRALLAKGLDRKLVRKESTVYAMNYIEKSPIEKLYTFSVTGEILEELEKIAGIYRKKYMDREMKSLSILEGIGE